MPQRVTLREVAGRAGVSVGTASSVLSANTRARVAEATRERVRRAAAELDYRPNQVARSLLTRRTRTLALVADALASDPFTGPLVQGASAAAADAGHLLFVAETGPGDAAQETRLLDRLADHRVDGFVYATAIRRTVQVPAVIGSAPTVLLNCMPADDPDRPQPACVLPDDRAAGRDVARALIEAGHRDGIHLVGEVVPDGAGGTDRLAGLCAELAAHGLELAAHHRTPWWPEPIRAALGPVLASRTPPTAIIALNDRAALGVYEALARARLGVPDEVSVMSFDDTFLASWLDPGLSGAALPYAEMGRLAVDLLIARIEADDTRDGQVHRLAMPLRRRGSLGPRRGQEPAGV